MFEPDKKTKWMSTALMGSLALNLFVGGFLVSQALSGNKDTPDDMIFTADFATLPINMPDNIREQVEDQMRDRKRELKRAYSDYSRQQRKINKIMREDEIDEDDLREAYNDLAEFQTRIQIPIREAMIAATQLMDRKTREAVIEARERNMPARIIIPKKLDGSRWKIDLEKGGIDIDVSRIIENSEAIRVIAEEAAREAEIIVREARQQYEEAKRIEKAKRRELRREQREQRKKARQKIREQRDKEREKQRDNDQNEEADDVDVESDATIQFLHEKEIKLLKIEVKSTTDMEVFKVFKKNDDYLNQFDYEYRTDNHN
jgi:uncharacterized membrane protein